MGNVVVIGCYSDYKKAYYVTWNQPFPNLEEFDSMIVDLTSLPIKDLLISPQNNITQIVIENFQALIKSARTFMLQNRDTFCIIAEQNPQIGNSVFANYSWIPHPEKISITKTQPGTSKNIHEERFAGYLDLVEQWNYEIEWCDPEHFDFEPICTNKSGKYIAATLSFAGRENTGKIHFLPKSTKNIDYSIELLVDLARNEIPAEYSWREHIEIPNLKEIEREISIEKEKIELINKNVKALQFKWTEREKYRDVFSKDDNKIPETVQKMLADFGINTLATQPGYVVDLLSSEVAVEVTSIKGKVDAQTKKITQLSRFIETERTNQKVIFVANTYKELPLKERIGKEHVTQTMNEFLKSVDVCCMTALTLYHLWLKVGKKEIAAKDACSLILKTAGVLAL